ncbi:MAG: 2-succinyl-5-enolpyruvyl-6-hydroxy-3-cyclohexene-1-carboxylic-acid synthase [Candidatus Sericytochromatia bacterium]|nr:2-succinyl-5-enolpyruvyl-6-hydroxy-3-cyclohexene-1-carboxylic-acid synthase [Candidatus Sericytochromatia bacterium]
MSGTSLNLAWARTIVRALVSGGVRHAMVAPGSRSAPLALALAEAAGAGQLQVHLHHDERTAAFQGLGAARWSGEPVALLCTSGTAGTHFHAAAAEARASGIPLVLLTADRPPDVRHAHAHQTIDQRGLYGPSVLFWRELGLPRADALALRHLQATVAQAVAATRGQPRGPVHLDVPFGDWLHPAAEPDMPAERLDALLATLPPVTRWWPTMPEPAPEAWDAVLALVREAERPLLVMGSLLAPWDGEAGSLEASGWAVLRDATAWDAGSGVPGGHLETMVRAAQALGLMPDLVIRVGGGPVSGSALRWLASLDVPVIQVQSDRERWDADGRATHVLTGAPGPLLARLAAAGSNGLRTVWSRTWQALREAASAHARETTLPPEPDAVRTALAHWPMEGLVVAGNSMAVRYVDFVGTTRARLLANRGASGIDGQVATALGARLASGLPTLLVTGDVSFLHDLGSWTGVRAGGAPLAVLLLDNDGGGIFHTLPIGAHPDACSPWCTTPHGLDPTQGLEGFGVVTHHPRDDAGLMRALDEALKDDRPHVLRIVAEREPGMAAWQAVLEEGGRRVAGRVGSWMEAKERQEA